MRVAYRGRGLGYEKGRVLNISRGGMYILTDHPAEIDDYIIASVDAEELGKIVWVQGRVVWSLPEAPGSEGGMAVRFMRSDQKGINALMNYRGIPF